MKDRKLETQIEKLKKIIERIETEPAMLGERWKSGVLAYYKTLLANLEQKVK